MLKTNTLKTPSMVFIFLLLLSLQNKLSAQCLTAPNGQWPTATFTPNAANCNGNTVQSLATNCFNGEYSRVNVISGETYKFTSSVATDYITVSNSTGTTAYAFGTTPVTWVASFTGVIRFYTHNDAACGSNTVNRTRAITCGIPAANDATVTNIYTLGKRPLGYADNDVIQARIVNNGSSPLTNLPVTLTVTGANPFNDLQTIVSLAPGASEIVTFPAYLPISTGTNTIVVSVPADDVNTNNSKTWTQEVTQNLFSYKDPTVANETGGVGFNLATGQFVAKYTSATAGQINEIKVDFATGGQPYQVGIWDATGTGGAPGANLWTSPSYTTAVGTAFIPVNPTLSIPAGDFYVGVMQTGTTNVGFAFQNESPLRANKFYYTSLGGTSWTELSGAALTFRLSIEAQMLVAQPPNCATTFIPADNAVNVDHVGTTNLTWASGGGGATSYDVYFGTTYPPPFVANQTGTSFPVTLAGATTYYLHVLAKNPFGDAVGCDTIQFTTVTPPANDDCGTPTSVTVNADASCTSTAPGTLLGASGSTGPASTCGTFDDDVWYTFVAAATTHRINIVHVSGSTSDYSFQVLDGCGAGANVILCSDPTTNINVPNLVVGNTYYLRVASFGSVAGQTSVFNVCIGVPPTPPANDLPCNAIVLVADDPTPSCVNTTAATYTTADNEPDNSALCSTPNNIVWYKFTPPASGVYYFTGSVPAATADGLSAWIYLYEATGSCPGVLTFAASGGVSCLGAPNSATAGTVTTITTGTLTGGTTYYIYVDGNSGDVGEACFRITSFPLSVQMDQITAENAGNRNRIDWNTLSESDGDYFTLERSADGAEFVTLDRINAKGKASDYQYWDENPLKGINYYRLKMTDKGGKSSYSKTVTATVKMNGDFVIDAYPNPVTSVLTIKVFGTQGDNPNVLITDVTGKVVRTQRVFGNEVKVNMEGVPQGIYLIKYSDNNHVQTLKVNKQ